MKIRWLAVFLLLLIAPYVLAHDDVIVGGEPYKKTEKILYDDDISSNSKEYFGWALPNTATSVSLWKIMRISYSGNDFTLEWADGNKNYDNEWDNRVTSVSYE